MMRPYFWFSLVAMVFLLEEIDHTLIVRTYLLQASLGQEWWVSEGMVILSDVWKWAPWIQKKTVPAETDICVLWTDCPQCFYSQASEIWLTPRADEKTSYKREVCHWDTSPSLRCFFWTWHSCQDWDKSNQCKTVQPSYISAILMLCVCSQG